MADRGRTLCAPKPAAPDARQANAAEMTDGRTRSGRGQRPTASVRSRRQQWNMETRPAAPRVAEAPAPAAPAAAEPAAPDDAPAAASDAEPAAPAAAHGAAPASAPEVVVAPTSAPSYFEEPLVDFRDDEEPRARVPRRNMLCCAGATAFNCDDKRANLSQAGGHGGVFKAVGPQL